MTTARPGPGLFFSPAKAADVAEEDRDFDGDDFNRKGLGKLGLESVFKWESTVNRLCMTTRQLKNNWNSLKAKILAANCFHETVQQPQKAGTLAYHHLRSKSQVKVPEERDMHELITQSSSYKFAMIS